MFQETDKKTPSQLSLDRFVLREMAAICMQYLRSNNHPAKDRILSACGFVLDVTNIDNMSIGEQS